MHVLHAGQSLPRQCARMKSERMRRALRAVVPLDSGVKVWDDPDLQPEEQPAALLNGRFLFVPFRRSI